MRIAIQSSIENNDVEFVLSQFRPKQRGYMRAATPAATKSKIAAVGILGPDVAVPALLIADFDSVALQAELPLFVSRILPPPLRRDAVCVCPLMV
jgi:hypothetical protein